MTTMIEAAASRAERLAGHGPTARPGQRRSSEDQHAPAFVQVRARITLQERAASASASDMLRFEGYASVTGEGYQMYDWDGPYTEYVDLGAFADTLAREGLDVPFVLGHDPMRRIARTTNGTLQLSEDTTGLLVGADLNPDDPDVRYIEPKLRQGPNGEPPLIDEMSFRFRIDRGQWSPDWSEFHIKQVDIHRGDVAIVGYGANPATTGSGLREQETPQIVRSRRVIPADLAAPRFI